MPENLVVLTFDDGVRSQLTFVTPLLKELGFGATFYITDDPRFHTEPDDFRRYMAYLKDGGYTVLALRDLRDRVDLSNQPEDPYAPIKRRLRSGAAH